MEMLTYLQDNLKNGHVIRWPESCFPLKFYIAPFRWYAQRGNDAYKYHSFFLRGRIFCHVLTWMSLEDIMLSEISVKYLSQYVLSCDDPIYMKYLERSNS